MYSFLVGEKVSMEGGEGRKKRKNPVEDVYGTKAIKEEPTKSLEGGGGDDFIHGIGA